MCKIACLILALILCFFPSKCARAEGVDDSNSDERRVVAIELTNLDVNDTTLNLSYTIKNTTNHNIWICDDVHTSSKLDFEVYLSKDEQSLIIRRRLDVPTAWQWATNPFGRYVLLRPDQERTESLSLSLPIQPVRLFVIGRATSDHAKHLILEIGFYNDDLPHTIREILEIGERLNCVRLDYNEYLTDLFMRYFKGIWISDGLFHGLSNFEELTYKEGNEEIEIPYTWQRFGGEQVLRMQVDGVHIPYEEAAWAIDEPPQSETEPADVTMALTGLDVNDTKLELGWKTMNNSDHNVWICDNVHVYWPSLDFEVYLSEDDQSLLIRRRLDVPTDVVWGQCPYGRYVLLRPDRERLEFLTLDVPVHPRRLFASGQATSDYAKRLVLEIGFYNEDLPGMIRNILEMAEKLNCARLESSEYETDFFIRYFKGIWIEQVFGGLSGFEDFTYQEGSEEINIPYTWQNFNGEQVLRIEVGGVHIPYEEKEN